jgi:hypothetical protein
MGLSRYTKRAVKAVATGGLSETARFGKKVFEKLTPDSPEYKGIKANASTIQPFDYSQLTKQLKQAQAVKGKAINPDIMKSLFSGAIEGQVGPAVEREAAAERRRQEIEMFNKKMEIEAETAEAAGKSGVGAAIGGVGGFLTGIPGGAKAGAGVGGILGGASIICTELYNQGLIQRKPYIGAMKYREDHIDSEAYAGYLMWADSVVRAMQESKTITKVVAFFWIPLTEDMASYVNNTKPNLLGRLVTKIVVPFSRCVYRMKKREVAHA